MISPDAVESKDPDPKVGGVSERKWYLERARLFLKQVVPIEVSPFGNHNSLSEIHGEKALFPIDVTVCGIVTYFVAIQLVKALAPIVAVPPFKVAKLISDCAIMFEPVQFGRVRNFKVKHSEKILPLAGEKLLGTVTVLRFLQP